MLFTSQVYLKSAISKCVGSLMQTRLIGLCYSMEMKNWARVAGFCLPFLPSSGAHHITERERKRERRLTDRPIEPNRAEGRPTENCLLHFFMRPQSADPNQRRAGGTARSTRRKVDASIEEYFISRASPSNLPTLPLANGAPSYRVIACHRHAKKYWPFI